MYGGPQHSTPTPILPLRHILPLQQRALGHTPLPLLQLLPLPLPQLLPLPLPLLLLPRPLSGKCHKRERLILPVQCGV